MQPPSETGAPVEPSRRRWARALLLGVLAVAILVGAATIWYFYFRPAGPPAIGTQAPVIPPGAVATAPMTPLPLGSPLP